MPLSVLTNTTITAEDVNNRFIKSYIRIGDLLQSNKRFGTTNKVNVFDYISKKRLHSILDEVFDTDVTVGTGNKRHTVLPETVNNNSWFNCCKIEASVCFDGTNFYDTSSIQQLIDANAVDGWVYEGLVNCKLKFTLDVPALPDSDIFAFFDTTSMLIEDGVAAKTALQNWFTEFTNNNPSYNGDLYILPVDLPSAENWLGQIKVVVTGSGVLSSDPSWLAIAALPPNYATPYYVKPDNVIILSFEDEANPGYHGVIFPSFGVLGDPNDPLQPTPTYVNDLAYFIAHYNDFTNFKQILYPINKTSTAPPSPSIGSFNENVLQMVAALYGSTLTPTQISNIPSSVDLSILETQNPYTTSLIPYNVTGVFNKVSPAVDVFNSSTFNQELNDLLDINEPIHEEKFVSLPIIKLQHPLQFVDNSWKLKKESYKNCSCLTITNKQDLLNILYKVVL